MNKPNVSHDPWWKHAVVYQIYPRSFQDSNGDGVGDLEGIRRRLGYISSLGVDAIWLSPIYVSPMVDFGYDVADYRDIDRSYGTLEEFDLLLEEAHRIGLRVILDLVPNHTSDQHPWFIESRRSRDSAKRDWYVWRDPAPDGALPNNWLSAHGGKAWSYDETTEQYYLHSFQPEMPELNWENQQVRNEIYDVMRFWLDRGVDGFRVDVILRLAKDRELRDEPTNPAYRPGLDPEYLSLLHVHTRDVTHVHEFVREFRDVIDEYDDRLLIGETYLPVDRLMRYYGDNDEVHLPFNFGLITEPFTASAIREYIRSYLDALPAGAWPNWVIGNHDNGRIAAGERAGSQGAAVAAVLLCTLPGTITLYYGDEIGMDNGEFSPETMKDNLGLNNIGTALSRDRGRTPMQWNAGPTGGFTTGEAWLPVNPDTDRCNVVDQTDDGTSLLNLYRRLIAFRRYRPEIVWGRARIVDVKEEIVAYEIGDPPQLVLLNLSNRSISLSRYEGRNVIVATRRAEEGRPFSGTVDRWGAVVLDPLEKI